MSEEDVKSVVDFTNRVLGASGLDLKAGADQTEDGIKIQVRGDDVALLLGHNAELLDALEYLGNRAPGALVGRRDEIGIRFGRLPRTTRKGIAIDGGESR